VGLLCWICRLQVEGREFQKIQGNIINVPVLLYKKDKYELLGYKRLSKNGKYTYQGHNLRTS
jgi:hypothetical protein